MRRHPIGRSSRFTLGVGILAAAAICTFSEPTSATPGTDVPTSSARLHAVSASSPTDAWAVGFGQSAPGENTLALTKHWDGNSWRTVASPHPGIDSFLWGVTDLSPTDAWAVGETLGAATIQPFAEHWDGSDWTVVPMNGPGLGRLNAVTANGPNDVWMVGTAEEGPRQLPRSYIAHWDGSRIRRVKAAKVARGKSNELTGVTALGTHDVWAVGEHGRDGQTQLPLIEHYDGTAWTVVQGGQGVGSPSNLAGVDGAAANDAWAVGWNVPDGVQTISALAEHWDGQQWTASATVTPGYTSHLTSVSEVSANDVWAVGSWARSQQDQRSLPLLEHWDGQAWSMIDSPPSRRHSGISVESVSMDSADHGFAVGDTTIAARRTPYIVQWDGSAWSR